MNVVVYIFLKFLGGHKKNLGGDRKILKKITIRDLHRLSFGERNSSPDGVVAELNVGVRILLKINVSTH